MMGSVLDRVFSLEDFQREACRFLPRPVYVYVAGGSEDQATLDENRQVFRQYGIVTRMVRDVSKRTLKTTLYGKEWSAPFGIAPMGLSALSGYRGDIMLARAARAAGIPMIVSGTSMIRMEETIQENPDAWFQAYVPGDLERTFPLLDRVKAAGYQTLVLTVDTFLGASRENQVRAGFTTPLRPGLRLALDGLVRPRWLCSVFLRTLLQHGMPHFENSFAVRGAPIVSAKAARDHAPKDHMDWDRVALIRKHWQGRLIVKGLLHPDDCRRARDLGADGIIVSNHGGRQMDGGPSPLRMLPLIQAELARTGALLPLMVDSGFRRGNDVLKALALGADFVFVGRPFNFACSVAGEPGVKHAIGLLKDETKRGLGMMGYNAVAEVRNARADGVLIDLPSPSVGAAG
jgi:L-lactate dehydrogenase (cytochrome)